MKFRIVFDDYYKRYHVEKRCFFWWVRLTDWWVDRDYLYNQARHGFNYEVEAEEYIKWWKEKTKSYKQTKKELRSKNRFVVVKRINK